MSNRHLLMVTTAGFYGLAVWHLSGLAAAGVVLMAVAHGVVIANTDPRGGGGA